MSARLSKRHSTNSIETSVTRLLVSTKHLLESLTQWARKEVDDKFVSDAYVKLGNDFRAASRAFTHAGVDISDIGDVPQALRVILESALSESPSPENLDRFLPNIRNIIVTLLQNLKTKQHKAKSMSLEKSKEKEKDKEKEKKRLMEEDRVKSANMSPGHSHSQSFSHTQSPTQSETHNRSQSHSLLQHVTSVPQSQLPPQPKSQSSSRSSSKPSSQPPSRSTNLPDSHSKSETYDSLPLPKANSKDSSILDKDALAQLQSESFLQRRASKRFSAYQYAKLANINPTTSLPNVSPERRSMSIKESIINQAADEKTTSDIDEKYVFLRHNNQTKKVFLKTPVSFASLRLLFVEKFAYSPGSSDFPNIYIVDPKSTVSYELEDNFMSDIKTGTVLCLNEIKDTYSDFESKKAEPVKDNSSQSIKDLESTVSELRDKIDSLDSLIAKSILDALSNVSIPAAGSKEITQVSSPSSDSINGILEKEQKLVKTTKEIEKDLTSIDGEIRVIRQAQDSNKSMVESYIEEISSKVKLLQDNGIDASKSSNRSYMEKCHSRLSEESDLLLTKVDDLQDLMEALRKDVAQRGVRISPQQLKMTMKDIVDADSCLIKMSEFIQKEKGVWKKIWEAELDKVCEEQQFFNLQDDLTRDLEEDLSKIKETYDLIEQCSVEQSKQAKSRRNKVVANLYIPEPGESLDSIKDAVLNEVAALRPDHESRVEAINRAERLREKNKQLLNMTEFQEELGSFVDDAKLRKSGGVDEIERQRQLRDIENLKSTFGAF